MVALLVIAVFAAIFVLVVGVILAGQRMGAPKTPVVEPLSVAPDSEAARWAEPAGPDTGSDDAFDWLTPVHAPGLLAGESLSTISFWDALLARLDGVEMMKQHLAQAGMRWTVGRLTMMMLLAGAATFAILLQMSWATLTLAVALSLGHVQADMWFGHVRIGPATLHPFALVYVLSGSAMISTIRIPKP